MTKINKIKIERSSISPKLAEVKLTRRPVGRYPKPVSFLNASPSDEFLVQSVEEGSYSEDSVPTVLEETKL